MSEGKRVDVVHTQRYGMCLDLHLACGHTLRVPYDQEAESRSKATCVECSPLAKQQLLERYEDEAADAAGVRRT